MELQRHEYCQWQCIWSYLASSGPRPRHYAAVFVPPLHFLLAVQLLLTSKSFQAMKSQGTDWISSHTIHFRRRFAIYKYNEGTFVNAARSIKLSVNCSVRTLLKAIRISPLKDRVQFLQGKVSDLEGLSFSASFAR